MSVQEYPTREYPRIGPAVILVQRPAVCAGCGRKRRQHWVMNRAAYCWRCVKTAMAQTRPAVITYDLGETKFRDEAASWMA